MSGTSYDTNKNESEVEWGWQKVEWGWDWAVVSEERWDIRAEGVVEVGVEAEAIPLRETSFIHFLNIPCLSPARPAASGGIWCGAWWTWYVQSHSKGSCYKVSWVQHRQVNWQILIDNSSNSTSKGPLCTPEDCVCADWPFWYELWIIFIPQASQFDHLPSSQLARLPLMLWCHPSKISEEALEDKWFAQCRWTVEANW